MCAAYRSAHKLRREAAADKIDVSRRRRRPQAGSFMGGLDPIALIRCQTRGFGGLTAF